MYFKLVFLMYTEVPDVKIRVKLFQVKTVDKENQEQY